jgi:hypothetical protein
MPEERGPQGASGGNGKTFACTLAGDQTQQPRPSRGEKGIAGTIRYPIEALVAIVVGVALAAPMDRL